MPHRHLNNRVALNEITDVASFDKKKTMLVWDFNDLMEFFAEHNIKIVIADKLESKLEDNSYYVFPFGSSPLILKARINNHLYYFRFKRLVLA